MFAMVDLASVPCTSDSPAIANPMDGVFGTDTVISACESDVAENKILLHYCHVALENYYIEYRAKKRAIDSLAEAFIGEIQKLQSDIFFDEKISPNQSNQMRTERTLARIATKGYMSSINRTLAEAVSARFQELRSSR